MTLSNQPPVQLTGTLPIRTGMTDECPSHRTSLAGKTAPHRTPRCESVTTTATRMDRSVSQRAVNTSDTTSPHRSTHTST